MSRKSLIVLSICLVIGAGIGLALRANACCDVDALCHGGVVQIPDTCRFYFTVDHDRQEGDQHEVKIWIAKGESTFVGFMMDIEMTLDANSTYYYYFQCQDCPGRDPNYGRYTLPTGDCD